MKIIHNAEMMHNFAQIMLSGQIESSKNRKGYHRSDAIACPLKCYWRMTEKEAIYDASTIGIFLIGQIAHVALHEYFDAQEEIFHLEDAENAAVTIDALHGEFPIESKTTRKRIYSKADIPNSWTEQLCIGMAVMNINKGFLMIINIVSFAVMVWEFELTDDELKMWRDIFKAKIKQLAYAIKVKKPFLLEPNQEFCSSCAYRPMRKRTGWKGCPYYKPTPRKPRKKT